MGGAPSPFYPDPAGDYDKGELVNVGKNYWTFEPAVSLSYMSSKISLELTAFPGIDSNTKSNATNYQTRIWGKDFVAEVNWRPEIDVKNRLEGDYIWFKLAMLF